MSEHPSWLFLARCADVYNAWLADGTPVFGQPASMWYPTQKGFCNATDGGHGVRPSAGSLAAEADCIEKHLRAIAAANTQRPLFVPACECPSYTHTHLLAMMRSYPLGDLLKRAILVL